MASADDHAAGVTMCTAGEQSELKINCVAVRLCHVVQGSRRLRRCNYSAPALIGSTAVLVQEGIRLYLFISVFCGNPTAYACMV